MVLEGELGTANQVQLVSVHMPAHTSIHDPIRLPMPVSICMSLHMSVRPISPGVAHVVGPAEPIREGPDRHVNNPMQTCNMSRHMSAHVPRRMSTHVRDGQIDM